MIDALLVLAAAVSSPFSCGAATRPGIAELGEDGVWRGRAVDLCRLAAEQVEGPGTPVLFHSYDDPGDPRAAAGDRIAFVSAQELAVVPALRKGPVVATERQSLVVPSGSSLTDRTELAGRLVCFIVGTRAEDALNAWAAQAHVAVERLAFQEPVEMQDAFAVGRCPAEAVDAREIAPDGSMRPLGPALAETPIMAATATGAGEGWNRTVSGLMAQVPSDR